MMKKETKLVAALVEKSKSDIRTGSEVIFATNKKQPVSRLLKFTLWLDRNIKFEE